jgi:hypothetical protein
MTDFRDAPIWEKCNLLSPYWVAYDKHRAAMRVSKRVKTAATKARNLAAKEAAVDTEFVPPSPS